VLTYEAVVTDPTLLDPFRNIFSVSVKSQATPKPSPPSPSPRPKPPSDEEGVDRELPSGISLPNIVEVEEAKWNDHDPPFDKYTALRIMITDAPSEPTQGHNGETETHDVYDFLINMDNLFMKSELKPTSEEVEILKARWKYGLVLVGLALLHDEIQSKKAKKENDSENLEESNGDNVASQVERFTRALAPILLPMINSLGTLDLESAIAMSASGEDT
jgi:hypothetical protein